MLSGIVTDSWRLSELLEALPLSLSDMIGSRNQLILFKVDINWFTIYSNWWESYFEAISAKKPVARDAHQAIAWSKIQAPYAMAR